MQQEDQNQTAETQSSNNQSDKKPGLISNLVSLIETLEAVKNPYHVHVKAFFDGLVADVAMAVENGAISEEESNKKVDDIFNAVAGAVGQMIGQFSDDPAAVVGFFVTSLCRSVAKGEMLASVSRFEVKDDGESDDHKCETCDDRDTCPISQASTGSPEAAVEAAAPAEPQSEPSTITG